MKCLFSFWIILCLVSCKPDNGKVVFLKEVEQENLLNRSGKKVKSRFKTPANFKRTDPSANSFQYYLQNFELKGHGSKVHLYNGKLKNRQDVHEAILDISVGTRDLQQCADAVMRLRAEFLYDTQQYEELHFNFTNGFKADYATWRQGQRIKVNGNSVKWVKGGAKGDSRSSFDQYLRMVFSYAGTLSLEKEMIKIKPGKLEIGDLFIQGGSPGHAVIIMDKANDGSGEQLFMLGQSYMPAQEIHILKNFLRPEISPWYSSKDLDRLQTPEWTFSKNDLRRFKSD